MQERVSAASFAEYVPAPTDRAFLAGKTGSGKTFASRRLLDWVRIDDSETSRKYYPGQTPGALCPRNHVIGYDAKGLIRWPGYTRVQTFDDLLRKANNPKKFSRIMYAPKAKELRDEELHERFFRLCYERGNCTVYVDEWYALVRGEEYPDAAHAILTRGREMNVPLIGCSQRPKNIPQPIMSEADVFFAFQLKMPQDRKKVAEMIPLDQELLVPQKLPKKYFYFYRDGEDAVVGPRVFSVRAAA